MTAKASVPVAKNTSALSIVVALSPNTAKVELVSIAQILKLTILNMMILPTLIQPPAANSSTLVRCSCHIEP